VISLKEALILAVFVVFLAGSFVFTPDIASRGGQNPDYDYEGDYVARIYELVDAANEYDSSTIKDYFAEKVTIAEFETGKFLVSVLVGLAKALNTEISASECEAHGKIVSCYVTIMTDLHRAAGHPPAEGRVEVLFAGAEVSSVEENGLIEESLDRTSDVFRKWLRTYYPAREASIWNDDGYVENFVAYLSWSVYWIRCQLTPESTPNCPSSD